MDKELISRIIKAACDNPHNLPVGSTSSILPSQLVEVCIILIDHFEARLKNLELSLHKLPVVHEDIDKYYKENCECENPAPSKGTGDCRNCGGTTKYSI